MIFTDVPTIEYHPSPEMAVRPLYDKLPIRSILDVGAGHGGIFDKGYWDGREMDRREACDIFWIRPMEGPWVVRTGVDVCNLTAHYAPKSFDFVQCMEVLEHVADPWKAMNELCRVARQFILISSADEEHHKGPEQERIEKINPHQKYRSQPLVKELKEIGFEVRVDAGTRRQLVAWRYV